jgi:hypothetical protein
MRKQLARKRVVAPISFAQGAVFAAQTKMAGDALEQHAQFFHAEGLGDVIVGSIFHRLHGGLHGPISGDGDDERIGAVLLDGMQRIESGRTGAHAEKNRVGAPFPLELLRIR